MLLVLSFALCRYAVSELLPESGNAEGAPAAAAKGGKGAPAKGKAAPKPAAPLVPQGKAKAEALIAAGMHNPSLFGLTHAACLHEVACLSGRNVPAMLASTLACCAN